MSEGDSELWPAASKGKRRNGMDLSIAILAVLVALLTLVAIAQGGLSLPLSGYREGFGILLGVLPQLLLGFALAGLITVLIPSEVIGRLLGEEAGFRGVLIATAAGIATPGGPYLQFPLVAALMRSGAGIGPIAAYLTAWSLLGANRALVWELPILGATFTLARWLLSILVPIAVGLALPVLVRALTR